jgi:uncharacterized delta-60 repeat protein
MRGLAWVLAALAIALTCAAGVFGAAPFKPGDLDPMFDGDGKVKTDFAGSYDVDVAYGVVVQSDGKVVAAGSASGEFGLARYRADGALDPTFDGDGKVQTSFGQGSVAFGYGVALQADGKIVMAGAAAIPGSGTASNFALARYNPDGSLDTGFDGDGKVVTDFTSSTDQAIAVVVQSDGKIVAAGASRATLGDRFDYAAARYLADGALDTSFSGDGKLRYGLGGTDESSQTVVVQTDGKVILGGIDLTNSAGVLLRFLPDGSIDTSFDGDGVAVRLPGSVADVALQSDGKILTVGDRGFSVTRFNVDGTVDTSFGGGTATTSLQSASANSVLVQPNGSIVAAGNAQDDFAVGRFEPDADLDDTFGSSGTVTTDLGGPSDYAYAVGLAPDGKIVAAGRTGPPGGNGPDDFGVVRYQGAFSPCTVPNALGKALAVARTRIQRAGCSVGRVTRKRSNRVKKGRVISQSPKPGKTVPNAAKVKLVVSKGRKP